MKSFLNRYKIVLLIIVTIVFVLSPYLYKTFYKPEPAVSNTTTSADKMRKFNSLHPGVFIVNENGEDYDAIGAIFTCVGYDVIQGSFEDYKKLKDSNCIFVVPENEAERLNVEDSKYITENMKAGQKIITWGKSSLSDSLDITLLDNTERIESYTWLDKSDIPISFKDSATLEQFTFEGSFNVLAEDKDQNPVMISGSYGNGDFIYSGIPLISRSRSSYEHFPFIMDAIKEQFGITPSFARDDLAFYVDIEYHRSESPAALAERIKSYGADQINLSAWYSPQEYGDAYKEIIEECHKRGISVFAWFELPFVSIEFWDNHPEWREKTASGEDAHIDWRCLMALSNPEALDEIKKYTENLIKGFDWDGVDIAEIYFESPGQGFEEKEKFTPMNDSFRKSFEERYEVDPIKAFNPFSIYYWKYNKEMKQNIVDYRVELITSLHEEFLLLCEELKKEKPYLKTSVTVIDSIADQNMREYIGVDAEAIAKLQDKYHFMLQIEDPFTLWNLGPDRYRIIGEEYRNIMSIGDTLAIDINVIDRGGEVYPTKKQRGVELYQLINSAGKYTDKVILYALATLEKTDMELVPYTRSNDIDFQLTSANEYAIKADKRFIWNTDTEGKTYYMDGEKWPFVSKQGVIIPGGQHKLKVAAVEDKSKLFIESINGEISDVSQDESINFSYFCDGRFYIVVNKKPSKVKIDGQFFDSEIKENGNHYTIVLPEGKHDVKLY
ncbi:MAG TPA: family 10 glycosylhydrolase [Patescibacteria group bacterium]|nr:family 10 glycosylhydrolase [Patescibacteria group bacterium]